MKTQFFYFFEREKHRTMRIEALLGIGDSHVDCEQVHEIGQFNK